MNTKKIAIILYCSFGLLILLVTGSVWSIFDTMNKLLSWTGSKAYLPINCYYLFLVCIFYYLPATAILLKNQGRMISKKMQVLVASLSGVSAIFFFSKYYMWKDPLGLLLTSIIFLGICLCLPAILKTVNFRMTTKE